MSVITRRSVSSVVRAPSRCATRPGSARPQPSSSTHAPCMRRRHAASESMNSTTCTAESHTSEPLQVPSDQKAASAGVPLASGSHSCEPSTRCAAYAGSRSARHSASGESRTRTSTQSRPASVPSSVGSKQPLVGSRLLKRFSSGSQLAGERMRSSNQLEAYARSVHSAAWIGCLCAMGSSCAACSASSSSAPWPSSASRSEGSAHRGAPSASGQHSTRAVHCVASRRAAHCVTSASTVVSPSSSAFHSRSSTLSVSSPSWRALSSTAMSSSSCTGAAAVERRLRCSQSSVAATAAAAATRDARFAIGDRPNLDFPGVDARNNP
eukprot:scaffold27788_cov63-Phaeocystis_antarctica.AAC.1